MKCLVPIQITVACADKAEAESIAHKLLADNLAACCQITQQVTSIYKWQGKIEQANECILVIKSVESLFENLCQTVKKIHSYHVPEIIALPVLQIEEAYKNWLFEQIKT